MTRLTADGLGRDAPWRRDSVSGGAGDLAEGLLQLRALLQLLNLVREKLDQLLKLRQLDRDSVQQLLKLLMLQVLHLLQLLQLLRKEVQQWVHLKGRREVGILRRQRSLSTYVRPAVGVELLRGITEWGSDSKCSSNHVHSFGVGKA